MAALPYDRQIQDLTFKYHRAVYAHMRVLEKVLEELERKPSQPTLTHVLKSLRLHAETFREVLEARVGTYLPPEWAQLPRLKALLEKV